jgi:hypothetical protein
MSKFFRHFKRRHADPLSLDGVYEVFDVVLNSDNMERMVVYGSVADKNLRWVRREDEFFGLVTIEEEHEGGGVSRVEVPRFAPMDSLPGGAADLAKTPVDPYDHLIQFRTEDFPLWMSR